MDPEARECVRSARTAVDFGGTSRSALTSCSNALESGNLRTLRMDGGDKVLAGVTTIEEVFRVTQMDVF